MSDEPDYKKAAEEGQKWIDAHQDSIEHTWGGDGRVAIERLRRWVERDLPTGRINMAAWHIAAHLDQTRHKGCQREWQRSREAEKEAAMMTEWEGDRELAKAAVSEVGGAGGGGDAGGGVELFRVADIVSDELEGRNGASGGTEGLVRGGASRERKVN